MALTILGAVILSAFTHVIHDLIAELDSIILEVVLGDSLYSTNGQLS